MAIGAAGGLLTGLLLVWYGHSLRLPSAASFSSSDRQHAGADADRFFSLRVRDALSAATPAATPFAAPTSAATLFSVATAPRDARRVANAARAARVAIFAPVRESRHTRAQRTDGRQLGCAAA